MIPRRRRCTARRHSLRLPGDHPHRAAPVRQNLARAAFADKPYVSQETPDEREFAASDPRGYPALYARSLNPARWLADYTMSYLERDVRQITQVHELSTFQRFLRLCAGRTGQLLNLANLAREAGVAQSTARAWLSVLEASYIVFLLPPHHRNLGKRVVKAPKLYFVDAALAASLMGIQTASQLAIHPLRGALFETLIAAAHELGWATLKSRELRRSDHTRQDDLQRHDAQRTLQFQATRLIMSA